MRQTSTIYLEWCNIWCNFSVSFISKQWLIYLFATGVSCEIACVDTTKLKNIPYISVRVTCTINFSIKETFKDLDAQFPGFICPILSQTWEGTFNINLICSKFDQNEIFTKRKKMIVWLLLRVSQIVLSHLLSFL